MRLFLHKIDTQIDYNNCAFFSREETSRAAIAELPLPPPDRPLFSSLKHQLYNARKSALPPIPKTVADVLLEGAWAETLRGETFLQSAEGVDDKILVQTQIVK